MCKLDRDIKYLNNALVAKEAETTTIAVEPYSQKEPSQRIMETKLSVDWLEKLCRHKLSTALRNHALY